MADIKQRVLLYVKFCLVYSLTSTTTEPSLVPGIILDTKGNKTEKNPWSYGSGYITDHVVINAIAKSNQTKVGRECGWMGVRGC